MRSEGYSENYKKVEMPSILPDFIAKSVLEIDFARLHREIGVKHVFLDVDLTIRQHRATTLGTEIIEHLDGYKKSGDIETISLVTNNRRNLQEFAKPLEATVFQPHRGIHKPHPAFFRRVLLEVGCEAAETVMVGDKLRPDIAGANGVGIYTVWVQPLSKDYIYDRILLTRLRERLALKRLKKKHRHHD